MIHLHSNMICKRCSFECDMRKYSTCPMNKVWAFRRTPYSLDMCCIFTYCTKNEQRLYFLTRSSHTWHNCHILQFKLQLRVRYGLILIVKINAQSVRKLDIWKRFTMLKSCQNVPHRPTISIQTSDVIGPDGKCIFRHISVIPANTYGTLARCWFNVA